MPCVNTSPFVEHTMSERIYCYLLYKITANWALRNKHKASPKDKPENHEERTCIIILLISDRRYKPCEENITNAVTVTSWFWAVVLAHGITQKVLRGLAASQWPVITCIWTATSPRASKAPQGSFASCKPHRWHNPYRKTGEQMRRLRPWGIWPGSPAPDSTLESPARTL